MNSKNNCMIIIMHKEAENTCINFYNKFWSNIPNTDFIFTYPEDSIPSLDFLKSFKTVPIGQNEYRGLKCINKYLLIFKYINTLDYDNFVVLEYDTINLISGIDNYKEDLFFTNHEGGNSLFNQLDIPFISPAFLSPWIFNKKIISQICKNIDQYNFVPDHSGYADRWISYLILSENIPWKPIETAVSRTDFEPASIEYVKERMSKNHKDWFHGIKNIDYFKQYIEPYL